MGEHSAELILVIGFASFCMVALGYFRSRHNPKCPHCQVRDSEPYEKRTPNWEACVGGVFSIGIVDDTVTRGRSCHSCHTPFNLVEKFEPHDPKWQQQSPFSEKSK
jgi:hypothetical protein